MGMGELEKIFVISNCIQRNQNTMDINVPHDAFKPEELKNGLANGKKDTFAIAIFRTVQSHFQSLSKPFGKTARSACARPRPDSEFEESLRRILS